jgi:hypothetical protein
MPDVDVQRDLEFIRQGHAVRTYVRGAERYTVNGRTWQLKRPGGTIFPVEGEGLIRVDQGAMIALKAYRRYNGPDHPNVARELAGNGVSEADAEVARRVWRIREAWFADRNEGP